MWLCFATQTPRTSKPSEQILDLFGRSSGLRVNYNKSSATMLNCVPGDETMITERLGCQIAELPLTYLGIPLTLRRPTSAQLQPLVNKAAAKLPTWKSQLMNKAGRLAMVKSVLSAMSIHQIMVIDPPRKPSRCSRRFREAFFGRGVLKRVVDTAMLAGVQCADPYPLVASAFRTWSAPVLPYAYDGFGTARLTMNGLGVGLTYRPRRRSETCSSLPRP